MYNMKNYVPFIHQNMYLKFKILLNEERREMEDQDEQSVSKNDTVRDCFPFVLIYPPPPPN